MTFHGQSKKFLRDLSRAAAWMMRRSVGSGHYWRAVVLTTGNVDTDRKRPVFPQAEAEQIFNELIARNLLVQRADDVDGTGVPAYAMRYDIEGWDKAVADGRPVYAFFFKLRRQWFIMLIVFLLGCALMAVQDRISGLFGGLIDQVIGPAKIESTK